MKRMTAILVAVTWCCTAMANDASPPTSAEQDELPVDAPAVSPDAAPQVDAVETETAPAATPTPARRPEPGTQSEPATGPPIATSPIFDTTTMQLPFQALFTDNDGVPLAGPVDLTFNIYSGGGGVIEGPIAVNNVPLTNGVASVTVPVTASTFDGSARELGVSVDGGAELSPRTPLVSVPHAIRVDRVTSEELDDAISLGDSSTYGTLDIFRTSAATPAISLYGSASQISTYGSDGLEQIRLWGGSWGEMLLYSAHANNYRTVRLSADNGSSTIGGDIELYSQTGASRLRQWGESSGGFMELRDGSTPTIRLDGQFGRLESDSSFALYDAIGGATRGAFSRFSSGAQIRMYDEASSTALLAGASSTAGGFVQVYQQDGGLGLNLDGDASGADGGGAMIAYQADGSFGVWLDGDDTNADGGGRVAVYEANGGVRVVLDGQSTASGGEVSVRDADGTETVEILGAESSTTGSQLVLRAADGTARITLDAEYGVAGDDARIDINGRTVTSVLEITGGADLSEQFDVKGDTPPEPGMVVSIDPQHEGALRISTSAYDRTVAGIISGAGGIRTGMMMGQVGSEANGRHPIALSGRVYCFADESAGAIRPGDLLTTSSKPGRCMKVTDHERAKGAVIGKAMGTVKDGLILVLVNLQ